MPHLPQLPHLPHLPQLSQYARRFVVDSGASPAAVLAVGVRVGSAWRHFVGAAGQRSAAKPDPVDARTPFDLASVTKPIVACAAARLVRRGVVSWADELGDVVPELAGSAARSASLESLLSHRAGLEAHRALYLPRCSGETVDVEEALLAAANAVRADCGGARPPHGFEPLYSDLGYLLGGALLSRATGAPLADIVDAEVAQPLGLEIASAASWRSRDESFLARVAPTEVVPFRGGEIVGVVHDENAWAISDLGISGHAGLFGTAAAVLEFGECVLDALAGLRDGWLESREIEPLVRPRPGGTLRAGFDGRAETGSAAGALFGPRSFGHLGFTGTSVWCDPDEPLVAVILTNRVNPSRDNIAIRTVRPMVGDALHALGRALREANRGPA